jgi:uncharacterized protein YyaL (SSP411 family)
MRALVLGLVLMLACGPGAPPAPIGDPLPGAPSPPAELGRRLRVAWDARPKGYVPRTRHLRPDGGPRYTNRLFLEASPYLLQHAHNPVDWHPWGDEAFETARRLGRPVLLSVGYSTCHWCHVMEEESFEDEEIARYLNEHYVVIKVDREERPDVDAIYMNAVQTLTGGGGWPMTVWLTPERRPFYGGTYFPPRDGDRGAGVGFLTLLRKLRTTYDEQPTRVVEAAASLAEQVRQNLTVAAAGDSLPGAPALRQAAARVGESFDATNGGMRGAPKFPSSLPVRFLLRYHRRTGDPDALRMAIVTLAQMAAGGIRDHVGGGFHRYSTDARWLVPHFEKMLYDNALLALAYLEGHQATGRADLADVAREILRYVDREMTAPEGGFYSATDADSAGPSGEREEGRFFTWTPAEVEATLDADAARAVIAYYAVTAQGNFEGRSILHTPKPLEAVAEQLGRAPDALARTLADATERLYVARAERPPPLRDDKILAGWNGLMISAHARAALALGDEAYAARAARAADFVLGRMRRAGRLARSWRAGRLQEAGYLDDYAFLIAGLLDLYEATGDPRWLRDAIALDEVLAAHFEDAQAGGFFMTSDDHEALLAREKPAYDGAEPSGNSVQALNLLRLHELTTQDAYRRRAERTIGAVGRRLETGPLGLTEMLLALDWQLDAPKQLVIATTRSREEAAPFLAALRTRLLPNRILAVTMPDDGLAELVPVAEGKGPLGGRVTGYVCENRVCDLPTPDPAVFARQIERVRPLPGG